MASRFGIGLTLKLEIDITVDWKWVLRWDWVYMGGEGLDAGMELYDANRNGIET